MSYPIVTPNASRINVTMSAGIDVSLGGAIKASDLRTNCLVINLYGDTGFIWAYGPNVALLRVKANGQFCWYANCNFSAFRNVLISGNINIVNFIGNNSVQVWSYTSATNYRTTVPFPTAFVNGGWLNFAAIPAKTPPCPCSGLGAINQTYYDAKNNLLLSEYIKSYPEDYQLWVSVYNPAQNGYSIVNQGYMGFFDNASNPVLNASGYNKVYGGITYSPNTDSTFSYDQNGNFIGRHMEFTDMIGAFCAFGLSSITPGGLDCSGTSTNYPRVDLTLNSVLNMNASIFNGYAFQSIPNGLCAGQTDIPGAICIYNTIHAINLYNGKNFVELYNVNGAGGSALYGASFMQGQGCVVCSKYNGATPPYNVTVFFATPKTALPDLQPPPVIQSAQATPLLNWHRPISTRGLFRT